MKWKLDPLFIESMTSLIYGAIYCLSLFLSSGFLHWVINLPLIAGTLGISAFEYVTSYSSLIVFIITTIKSVLEIGVLSWNSIRRQIKK